MRIPCPLCGERDNREFSILGDASVKRPDPDGANAQTAFFDYVYLRDNPAGAHRELWFHEAGCRQWLVVSRDTITHEVSGVVLAADRGKAARR